MLLIVGASASGKTEVSKLLVKHFGFNKVVTTTTRKPRPGEVDTVDYYFFQEPAFLELIKNNLLVEYAIYQGNYYGVQKKDIRRNSLIILEPKGVNNLIKIYGDEVLVILIESSKEKRIARMRFRKDKESDIKKRIISDDKYYAREKLTRIDHIIENENITLMELAKKINEFYETFKNK